MVVVVVVFGGDFGHVDVAVLVKVDDGWGVGSRDCVGGGFSSAAPLLVRAVEALNEFVAASIQRYTLSTQKGVMSTVACGDV